MISILIPLYNYDATALVTLLVSQLSVENIDFEIICIDDASPNYYLENDKLNEQDSVVLHKLSFNVGRSKIRNLLAEKATYNWLLFLDTDVIPKDKNFIVEYLNCIKSKKAKVFCGGIAYSKTRPEKSKMLRWVYGKNREEISTSRRMENPYAYFFGANFLIHKSIFEICSFDETIIKYGYEDLLFVEKLKENKINIEHINNVVYHLGIEDSGLFLSKTKQALENLYTLSSLKILVGRDIKLLQTYRNMEKYKLKKVLSIAYLLLNKIFEINLKSKKPSLVIFDLFKLTYFCYLSDKKITSNH